jgi:hypothetical protein
VVDANAITIALAARRFFNMVVYLFLILNNWLNAGNKKGSSFG